MNFAYNDARHLTSAINKIKPISTFISDEFFSKKENAGADTIDFEVQTRKNKLARFVNANEDSILIGKAGRKIQTVKIPRIFEKKVFTANELAKFRPIGGVYTSAEEAAKASAEMLATELADLKDRCKNRLEQMCCQAIDTGMITVTQDNIEFEIDFGFATNVNKVTLTGTNTWSGADENIIGNIRAWRKQMSKNGSTATDLILGGDAADQFIKSEKVLKALDNNNYGIGRIDLNQQYSSMGIFLGTFQGLRVWEHVETYTNDAGNDVQLIGAKKAILIAKNNNNKTFYAPITRIADDGLDIIQSEYFVQPNLNSNRTNLTWEIESKQLPVIMDNSAVFSAQVLA